MSGSVFWRAALIQAVAVAVLSIALAIALPTASSRTGAGSRARWPGRSARWSPPGRSACRSGSTLLGAALAGIPSLIAALIGVHWLGAVVAIGLFAVWCARLPGEGPAWT